MQGIIIFLWMGKRTILLPLMVLVATWGVHTELHLLCKGIKSPSSQIRMDKTERSKTLLCSFPWRGASGSLHSTASQTSLWTPTIQSYNGEFPSCRQTHRWSLEKWKGWLMKTTLETAILLPWWDYRRCLIALGKTPNCSESMYAQAGTIPVCLTNHQTRICARGEKPPAKIQVIPVKCASMN